MMPELSLNILDVAQNSVTAGSALTTVSVAADTAENRLTIRILDTGCGMTPEQVQKVTDPFYTTRTTRKVGLGVPFFKMAAEMTGGSFQIDSTVGKGTAVTAVFTLDHIDRMPLGDIASTMTALIGPNPDRDFILDYRVDDRHFTMDTREFRSVLGPEISLSEPQVLAYIAGYIGENIAACGPAL